MTSNIDNYYLESSKRESQSDILLSSAYDSLIAIVVGNTFSGDYVSDITTLVKDLFAEESTFLISTLKNSILTYHFDNNNHCLLD